MFVLYLCSHMFMTGVYVSVHVCVECADVDMCAHSPNYLPVPLSQYEELNPGREHTACTTGIFWLLCWNVHACIFVHTQYKTVTADTLVCIIKT